MTTNRQVKGLAVDIMCAEPDELRFCRKLSADVNQGTMSLVRVMVLGRQVYPRAEAVLGVADVLLRCEFRIRDASVEATDNDIRRLFERLSRYVLVDAHTIDHAGGVITRVEVPVPAHA